MMRNLFLICSVSIVGFLIGCSKGDNGTNPPPTEDFTFPASSDTALTLYSGTSTVSVNQTFDIKVVCYNVSQTFGAAFEVGFTNGTVTVESIVIGPFFDPADQTVSVTQIENTNSRVSFGTTYQRGSGKTSSGSGVVFKIRCKGTMPGAAQFTLNQSKIELRKSDGTLISNFDRLQYQNLSVTVQ